MKKIFTLMLAFACALFVGVSCTPDNGDGSNAGPSYPCTLTLETPSEVSAEGGSLSLAYTVAGEEFIGTSLLATTEATWLSVALDEENHLVNLTVSANPSVAYTRSGEVTLTYVNDANENLAAPVTVTVSQAHGTPVFSVNWSDATPKSVYAQVNAVDQNVTWVAFAMGVSNEQQADEFFLSQLNGWAAGGMGAPAGLYKNLISMQMQYGFVFGTGTDVNTLVYCKDEAWENEATYLCVVGLQNIPEALKNIDMNAVYESEEAYMAFMEAEDTTTLATAVHAFKLATLPVPAVCVSNVAPTAPYAGGTQTLDVTVENPYGEGALVSISEPKAAWLTAAYEDGKLTLTCAENPYAVSRTTSVDVTYTYSVMWTEVDWSGESMTMPREFESTATVTVSQEKNTTVAPITLDIKTKATHFNGIVVDVTPSDSEVEYVLDATWEPSNGWDYQYENKLGYIGNRYNPTTLYKGTLTDHLIKVSPNQIEYNGTDLVIYAFAVNAETKAMISDPVQIPVTLDEVAPVFTIVCENGITNEEGSTYYNLNVDPGTKVTVKFNVENQAWCGGQILCTTTSDSYNVIDEDLPLIVDQEAGTVTFTVSEYDSSKRYHHCSLGFKYTNADEDNWQLSVSLKVTQNAPAVE